MRQMPTSVPPSFDPTPGPDPLRAQYDRHPYPPIPVWALPAPSIENARYEHGARLAFGAPRSHEKIEILVAGCGTFEAVALGRAHPRAARLTAIDWSPASIKMLRNRARLARVAAFLPLPGRRLPPLEIVEADFMTWDPGPRRFDVIYASNVLHHLPDPARGLARLAGWLKPDGLIRMVTYPRGSRLFMRATSAWLRADLRRNGIDPESISSRPAKEWMPIVRASIDALPENDPIRSCFESQPETGTPAGLIDAFLNARENPLSPLEWGAACQDAGLALAGECQDEGSRSTFLDEMLPKLHGLDAWEKLQILDDVLELCVNPIIWLVPHPQIQREEHGSPLPQAGEGNQAFRVESGGEGRKSWSPSLSHQLRRADRMLRTAGSSLAELIPRLQAEVGPRVTPDDRALPGLSILDHDWQALLAAPS